MYLKNIYIYIICLWVGILQAQPLLTLEDAVRIGLENNYSMAIAENDKRIAKTQNNIGNAGMSPTLNTTASTSGSSVNSYQAFSTGTTQERIGARSQNTNAALNLSWTIFDGFKMFAIKKRLGITEDIAQLNYQQTIQNAVYDISLAYYDIVRIQHLMKALQQNLSIYEEREKVSKLRYEVGMDAKMDLALIQLDKNTVVADLKRLDQQLSAAKITLNKTLSRSVQEDFVIHDTIKVQYNPSYPELRNIAMTNNTTLLASRRTESMMDQYTKEARGYLFPVIQLNSSYTVVRAKSQAGLQLINQQTGPNAGVTASWLLFNGFKNSQYVQERKLRYISQQYLTRQQELQIDVLMYTQYKNYVLQQEILSLEKQNMDFAQSIVGVSLERYKVGRATVLETLEVQKSVEDTQSRYITSLFEAKRAELDLLKSTNQLVK